MRNGLVVVVAVVGASPRWDGLGGTAVLRTLEEVLNQTRQTVTPCPPADSPPYGTDPLWNEVVWWKEGERGGYESKGG